MMKKLIASVLLLVLPMAVLAQAPVKKGGKAARLPASRVEIKTTASQMASGIIAAEAALTPAELAIAERVFQGNLPCELGAFVAVTADTKAPGYFDVKTKNQKFRMFPVETSTGAIRLEDQKAGAVWLQLANKSMLMNQKLGQRLADVCVSPEQAVTAEMLLKNPAPSILEPLPALALSTLPAPALPAVIPKLAPNPGPPSSILEAPAVVAPK